MRNLVIISLFILLSVNLNAQINSSTTLLEIENKNFTVSDFFNAFNQQENKLESQQLQKQVDLFLNYQLKVKEAKNAKIDTLKKFQKEFKRYRNQLADSYIANGEVTKKFAREAYNRLKKEVKASHVLIKIPEKATKQERTQLYNKAKDVAGKARRGADFESLALQYSDDPSAKRNKGDLGWFRAFQMTYPFESAVYNIQVGEIAAPVKTEYGYHIIKKTGQRKSQGEITVAHIVVKSNKKNSTEISAKQKIERIYSRLQKGEDFSKIARQESDDRRSASKGGQLTPFSVGDINSVLFENKAFALKNTTLSQPFKTRFGWHIIKKIKNEPIPSFDKKRKELIKRIKTTKRVKLLNDKIQKNILQYHDMKVDSTVITSMSTAVDSSVYKYRWKASDSLKSSSSIFLSIDSSDFNLGDFAAYFEKQQRTLAKKPQFSAMVREALGRYVYDKLITHHKNQLEDVAPDFKSKMKKYKEGLMVFELMERKVWNEAKNDLSKLKKYYQNHKDSYFSKPKLSGLLVNANSTKQLKKLKQKLVSTDSMALIKKAFPGVELISLNKHPLDGPRLPENLKVKENKISIYRNPSQLVKMTKYHPPRQLGFKEAKGKVIAEYQELLEKKFVSQLREKYDFEIKKEVLEKMTDQS